MAKRKRGRATSAFPKHRRITKFRAAPSNIDYDREYKIRQILREDQSRYLIDWEDDEETGETYAPTWEPKANANQLAVDDWLHKKRQRRTPSLDIELSSIKATSNSQLCNEETTSSDPIRHLGRRHKARNRPAVIPSTSPLSQATIIEIDESPKSTSQALSTASSAEGPYQHNVTVIIGNPPSSFENSEYFNVPGSSVLDFSQSSPAASFPGGEAVACSLQRAVGSECASQLLAAEPCIPDSQNVTDVVDEVGNSFPTYRSIASIESISGAPGQSLDNTSVSVQAGHSLLQQPSSSPFPSLPSTSIQPVDSISRRPITPTTPSCLASPKTSTVEASSQPTPPATLQEIHRIEPRHLKSSAFSHRGEISSSMRHINARNDQTSPASENSSTSPSTIAAMEPMPTFSPKEIHVSAQYESPLARASQTFVQTQQIPENMNTSAMDRGNIHLIPIPLLGHQRDQYPYTIWYHRDVIERFLSADDPDATLVFAVEEFLNRMRSLTVHPDLDNIETLTQFDVHASQQAQWDIDCSAKFRFLKVLFDELRATKSHVMIFVSSRNLVNKLKVFLHGISVTALEVAPTTKPDDLTVTVVEADAPNDVSEIWPPNLVIAIDRIIQRKDALIILPQISEISRSTILWTSLVVPNSVEHIDYSLSPLIPHAMRLKAVLNGAFRLRKEAGKLTDSQWDLEQTAETLAQLVAAMDTLIEWPIPELEMLVDLDSETQSESVDRPPAPVKRRFDESTEPIEDEDDETSHKRARATDPAIDEPHNLTINPQDVEITHVSDSIARTTQMDNTHADEDLREQLKQLQGQVIEYEESLSGLQFRFEEQREQLVKATVARDSANESARMAVTRLSEQASLLSGLKAERSALKVKLEEAQVSLSKHEVPERAELEKLRIAAEAAQAERDQANNRLETIKRDLEYAQTMYQQSSTSAQTLAAENKELENQLQDARRRAEGRQAELRQTGHDARVEALRRDIKRYRALVQTRDQALRLRDEEMTRVREANRGRMGTRGGSIPRSPRLGSPLKMGSRSRQSSPAAGDIRNKGGAANAGHLHPLRNS